MELGSLRNHSRDKGIQGKAAFTWNYHVDKKE